MAYWKCEEKTPFSIEIGIFLFRVDGENDIKVGTLEMSIALSIIVRSDIRRKREQKSAGPGKGTNDV